MRKTMNISVPEEMYLFIHKRGQSYRFCSVSEYIRSLVRQDQFDEMRKNTPYRPARRVNDLFTVNEEEADELTPENDTAII